MERNNALYSRQLDELVVVLVKKKKNIIPNCRSETENKPLCTYQFSVRFRFRVAGWRELAPQALAVQNKWDVPAHNRMSRALYNIEPYIYGS